MISVRAAPESHLPWIAQQARLAVTPQLRAIEAVDERNGRILGMVAYDGWLPNACAMHVAISEPIAVRRLLRPAFGIPFLECKLGIVLAWVLGTNERSLHLVRHLGFKETHRIRDGWEKGVDLVLFEMRRENCKWIPQEARRVA